LIEKANIRIKINNNNNNNNNNCFDDFDDFYYDDNNNNNNNNKNNNNFTFEQYRLDRNHICTVSLNHSSSSSPNLYPIPLLFLAPADIISYLENSI
jgi:hypothetical protein